ncbi:molybdenum cofactor guanylyltransferase [Paenibacillus sp. NFR01]|uniref:molybdenum cofactor guanylyltransferase n=1 Tax=Paenibacillus sp. NFR01 TaxID=1566279 RepID=UPI0008B41D29|nr:molybdenum cofactor guanylyltransferase [Paenibacillus sp. NFR01]SET05754.1 molybdopterin-guanine dinucleotide biosynthesis protein A [Paenibacillus sp. NFR01]
MLTGVVLAGGRNSRMKGQNKAMLTYRGEPFIVRQVKEMRTVCSRIIVVTPEVSAYEKCLPSDILFVSDVYAGHGPLSGFHAAFTKVETEYAWVVGCDYPDISGQAASWMLSWFKDGDYDAVLPVIDGIHQMLHGIYRPQRLLPEITARLEMQQYRLSGLLDRIHWLGVCRDQLAAAQIETSFTVDIDTPEQYQDLLEGRAKKCGEER